MEDFWKVVGIVAIVAMILTGGWFAYWALAKQSNKNQYEINRDSQQSQAALIQQERDYAQAYNAAIDPAQKAQIKDTFCILYLNLKPAPDDLVSAHASIC